MGISTAVDASAVARVVGIETAFKNLRAGATVLLPQRVALVGQGNSASSYSTDKAEYTSALAVAQAYGFGSPLHLAALQLLPENGDGIGTIPLTVYPLEDAGTGVTAQGDISPTGTVTAQATITIKVNNIAVEPFVVSVGDSVTDVVAAATAAINAKLEQPLIAADAAPQVNIDAKWAGASGNGIFVEVEESTPSGLTWAVFQPTGGAVNPDVQTALDQVGEVWESIFINCMEIADTTTLDTFSTFGEGRWGALTRRPCVVFTGNTATTVASATTVSDARGTDRTNGQLVAPGSNDLPFVVAARQVARIARIANNNPPRDYGSQQATGLTPGADGDQWTYADRDSAVKKGSSTIEVKDGVVNLSDTLTFYHPTGDNTPAYRYVVDIVKLQQVLFNLDLAYATEEWDGAPLLPDDQVHVNPDAKQPKDATALTASILDGLGQNGVIADVEASKASIVSEIDSANPKRLNQSFTIKLAGNTNIISIDNNFGFFFGVAA